MGVYSLVGMTLLVALSSLVVGRDANFRYALNAAWQWISSGAVLYVTVLLTLAWRPQRDGHGRCY